MPHFTDLTGLGGLAFALGVVAVSLPGVRGMAVPKRKLLFAAVMVLALVPFGALPAAGYLRGAFGDLSITTLVLLGAALRRRLSDAAPPEERGPLGTRALVAAAALALYPMALGVGLFDPYRLGFGSPWLVGAVGAIALAAWWRRIYLTAVCLALAMLAWSVRWYESGNLWDYLLDPLVSLYALGWLAWRGAKGGLRLVRGGVTAA